MTKRPNLVCIVRLRALAADPKLTSKERNDLVRAIQGLQYTRVGGLHHDAVREVFEPDRPPQDVMVLSLEEARLRISGKMKS